MRILIAPDKFKGVLSAREVAEIVAGGLRDILPDVETETTPMADGGEGTADVMRDGLGGSWHECEAHDPLGRKIRTRYAWMEKERIAVVEMSEAAGMRRLQNEERDPDAANTFGVGEMMLAVAREGASKIVVGLGGSATNDGGFGLARALGFRFLDDKDELPLRTTALQTLSRIGGASALAAASPSPEILAAADVTNPLLGENGATRVFGPQKGVTPQNIPVFEAALARLADVATREFGVDYRNDPSAGAAGGLGFGLATFAGAILCPGFDIVATAIDLAAKIQAADMVITGEGSLDRQTLSGKTAAGVARLARKLGKTVYAVAGRTDGDPEAQQLFDGVYIATPPGMPDDEAMAKAPALLCDRARELAKHLKERPKLNN